MAPRKQKKSFSSAPSEKGEDTPLILAFKGYREELDAKHDRHERIVKFSRDITIESKRIIFLLHSIDARKNNKSKVLEEAQQRLQKLIMVNFKTVATELIGQDPYQFRAAFSPGLQEFIEAYSFWEYLSYAETNNTLSDWEALQQKMQYTTEVAKIEKKSEANVAESVAESVTTTAETSEKDIVTKPSSEPIVEFQFSVDPNEYILGLSDLTGELMRRCINSLGSGETDACNDACKILQQLYTGYIRLNVFRNREMSRKIFTMRQSVLKAENVCYNVKVRGSEAAKWGAVFENKPADDVDEGFF